MKRCYTSSMKIGKQKIISIVVFAALIAFSIGVVFFILPAYIRNQIDVPPEGILNVDNKSMQNFENGSEKYPFKTINAALLRAKERKGMQTLLIKGGVYGEQLELNGDIALSGIGEVRIENDILARGFIIMDGRTILHNIQLYGGHNGIEVRKNAKVILSHSEIVGAKNFGLVNEAHDEVNDGDDIVISKSKIAECGSQGLYLRKADIMIVDSITERNKEEGIDLHTGVVATVRNCTIADNGEGGIETEVGDNKLIFENDMIVRNGSSGINMQSSTGNASILIANNEIRDNGAFGIRCTYHSDVIRPYFAKYVIIEDNNVFSGNGDREMPGTCTNKNK